MASTYTDANGKTNCPVLFESIGSDASFIVAAYVAGANPNTRRGSGGYVAMTASGSGVRTLSSIPVRPGDVIDVTANLKGSGTGAPVMTVVAKDATSTVFATFGVGGLANIPYEGQTNISQGVAPLRFVVPAGVKDIEVRITQSTATATNCYFDDVRVMRVDTGPNPAASSRYLIEDLSRPIVWLGDSWADGMYTALDAQLTARAGAAVEIVDAGVPGQQLYQMNARIATDVLPSHPRYCLVTYGMNDLSGSRSQANMEADIDLCITTLRAAGIKPIITGIPPMTSQWSTSNDRNDQIRDRVMLHTI